MYNNETVEKRRRSLERLQREQEPVRVSRQGYLWKQARWSGAWLRRWHLCRKGVLRYCEDPMAAENGRVMSGQIVSAEKVPGTKTRGQQHMHPFVVVDETGRRKRLWCESAAERDAWCLYLSSHAQKEVQVAELYDVDWHHMLGCGGFAAVVRAVHQATGEPCAIKVISREAFAEFYQQVNREVAVMYLVGRAPHLLWLREVLYAPRRLLIVTELLEGGELGDRVRAGRGVHEAAAAALLRQVLLALAHLQDHSIVHMDLKPENIMFTTRAADAPIKLIDFSLSTFFNTPTEPGGTAEFMAPELVDDPEGMAARGWGGEVDMWAVGILLYFLLCGTTPFDDRTIPRVLHNVQRGRWAFKDAVWSHISDAPKDIIRSLLRRNPRRRPLARELLEHPWLAGASENADVRPAAAPNGSNGFQTIVAASERNGVHSTGEHAAGKPASGVVGAGVLHVAAEATVAADSGEPLDWSTPAVRRPDRPPAVTSPDGPSHVTYSVTPTSATSTPFSGSNAEDSPRPKQALPELAGALSPSASADLEVSGYIPSRLAAQDMHRRRESWGAGAMGFPEIPKDSASPAKDTEVAGGLDEGASEPVGEATLLDPGQSPTNGSAAETSAVQPPVLVTRRSWWEERNKNDRLSFDELRKVTGTLQLRSALIRAGKSKRLSMIVAEARRALSQQEEAVHPVASPNRQTSAPPAYYGDAFAEAD